MQQRLALVVRPNSVRSDVPCVFREVPDRDNASTILVRQNFERPMREEMAIRAVSRPPLDANGKQAAWAGLVGFELRADGLEAFQ